MTDENNEKENEKENESAVWSFGQVRTEQRDRQKANDIRHEMNGTLG